MTAVTEPHLSGVAAIESYGAAIHALPIDELGAVPIVADVSSNAHLFHEAGAADQILAPGRVLHVQLTLTVDETAEVGLFTVATHIEADLGFCELHELAAKIVAFCGQARVFVELLGSCNLHCFNLKIGA